MVIKEKIDNWYEELPRDCPPKEAISPNGVVLFRLCENALPNEKDFLSIRTLFPDKYFKNVSECITKSLSCWDSREKCLNLKKLPVHKDKLLMKVILYPMDGVILKTFKNPNHYSWWRTKSFKLDSAEISE